METAQAYPVVIILARKDGHGPAATEDAAIALGDQLAVAGIRVAHLTGRRDGMLSVVVEGRGADANAAVLDAVRRVEAVAGGWLEVDGAEVADLSAR